MTGTRGSVYLLGSPEETGAAAEALRAEGFAAVAFSNRESFLDATFQFPPWAAVLWWADDGEEADAGELCEVLRHHLAPQDSVVILVGDERRLRTHGPCASQVLIPSPAEPERIAQLLAEREASCGETGGHIPRILVVDDDQSIVLLGSHIISGMGMIPLVAFDGLEAVEKTKTLHPDLILLDINMPGMDGFDVIRAVKADPAANLIPIIVFSARRRDEDKVRALEFGADDYVTKPFSLSELSARIDRLLKRTRTGMSASSTTGLPGSVSVEQVLGERVRHRVPLAVLYLDVDHFKAFNDCYGFCRGDSLIRQVADLVLGEVRELGNPDDLVGHIGGDDFIVVTTPDRAVPIADAVIEGFDRITPLYYDAADRSRGYLVTEARRGGRTEFPLVSISIAIVTNEAHEFQHAAEISDVAAQLKRYAKTRAGSLWVKDQRAGAVQKE